MSIVSPTGLTTPVQAPGSGKRKYKTPAFLVKLVEMLEDATLEPYIHWSESGDSFVIPSEREFSKAVLPNFFQHGKFPSFQRQLNLYAFNKISNATGLEFGQVSALSFPLFAWAH